MTIEEILAGESKNVEFKENLPEKSIKYMKSVVAFANGTGGKIIFGIADKTREVIGFDKEDVFKKMDAIANAVSDSCEPAIIPDITLQTVNGKTVIVVEVSEGRQRPYYIKTLGRDGGVYALVRDDFFMRCIKKSSLTRSVAPPLKIAIAGVGLRFCFSDLTVDP